MATRCYIGKALPNGNIQTVYCHFDGYLSYVGSILLDHYNSKELVDQLIDGGDMSSLGETIDQTEYYIKRGEDIQSCKSNEVVNWKSQLVDSWCEYYYIYNPGTSMWYYAERSDYTNNDMNTLNLKDLKITYKNEN
jgi:hypothetical protein